MSNKKDPYASEAETQALLVPDTRTIKGEEHMSKEAIAELQRLRSILSGTSGLEDDDQEYIEDARKSVDQLIKQLAEQPAQQEPFGYFKAGPFGWTDCAETDEGAVALYTTPQPAQQTACTWAQPDSDHMPDIWEAACGAMWTFTEGGPKDNDMHFCPKCGKPAIEAAKGIKDQP